MLTIYVYVLDTLADWELGYATAELNSGRFFRKDAPRVTLRTISHSREPVKTMGGMTIVPDGVIDDLIANETSMLILPGANTWSESRHRAVIEKAGELLTLGGTVCAICGATAALSNLGLLDTRPHTSNGPGFLDLVSPSYKGQKMYIDRPAVAVDNLITAGSTGALPWAKEIIARAGVFRPDTLEAWYDYFRTGKSEHFFALMQTVQV